MTGRVHAGTVTPRPATNIATSSSIIYVIARSNPGYQRKTAITMAP
jgi:hypothetical protein